MAFPSVDRDSWTTAWPDALAFAAGLLVAGLRGWQTTDLVWSLWLSSIVVGYAMMAWPAVRTMLAVVGGAWHDRSLILPGIVQTGFMSAALFLTVGGAIGLGIAAFMTLHFVGFHLAHATALGGLFPLDGVTVAWTGRGMVQAFGEIFQRYWAFLPSAFIAERVAFTAGTRDDGTVTPGAIEARTQRNAKRMMTGPYRNVIRMHGLIFFLGLAHFAGLRSAAVYLVVYAAYFFPWRLLSMRSTSRLVAAASPGPT